MKYKKTLFNRDDLTSENTTFCVTDAFSKRFYLHTKNDCGDNSERVPRTADRNIFIPTRSEQVIVTDMSPYQ